jgi:Leucine-rich repeat (LRR) protein
MDTLYYDVLELILSYIEDYQVLVSFTKINKLFYKVIHSSSLVWCNSKVIYTVRAKGALSKYPIQMLICYMPNVSILPESEYINHMITNDELKSMPLLRYFICHAGGISNEGLKYVPNLEVLDCRGIQITDEGLKYVPNLKILKCPGSRLTNKGLQYVPKLRKLMCCNTKITGKGFKYIPNLRYLDCSNTKTTDYGFWSIPQLCHLNCSDTMITDNGLSYIHKITYLNISGTHITSDGFKHVPLLAELVGDYNANQQDTPKLVLLNRNKRASQLFLFNSLIYLSLVVFIILSVSILWVLMFCGVILIVCASTLCVYGLTKLCPLKQSM